jgi:acetyl-CoA carboxylase carboxyltransferase component
MIDQQIAAIIIATIGGAFAVWSAYVSNKNQKATKNITTVLNNTKTPVDSLDQVIKVLQDELLKSNKRHELERAFFVKELERLRTENAKDRLDWQMNEQKMQDEIDKLISERMALLDQIRSLKDKLSELEVEVRKSLDTKEF